MNFDPFLMDLDPIQLQMPIKKLKMVENDKIRQNHYDADFNKEFRSKMSNQKQFEFYFSQNLKLSQLPVERWG